MTPTSSLSTLTSRVHSLFKLIVRIAPATSALALLTTTKHECSTNKVVVLRARLNSCYLLTTIDAVNKQVKELNGPYLDVGMLQSSMARPDQKKDQKIFFFNFLIFLFFIFYNIPVQISEWDEALTSSQSERTPAVINHTCYVYFSTVEKHECPYFFIFYFLFVCFLMDPH